MPSDLKPTSREERERWKASCLYHTGPNDHIILRLIADVERLEADNRAAFKDYVVNRKDAY